LSTLGPLKWERTVDDDDKAVLWALAMFVAFMAGVTLGLWY
jgi:hypothetical protein